MSPHHLYMRPRKTLEGMAARPLLSREEVRLISETKDLMESVLETQEILADRELMEGIRRSRKDLEAGRVRRLRKVSDLWK